MLEIYFPECRFSKVSISLSKIFLATFLSSPETSSPTLMILILAKYKDSPLLENAIIIKSGIAHAKVLSCSINIFHSWI